MSWVDLDRGAAAKVAEILKSLEETDTIDQLGLGVLRDSVSDYLFPSTSTLMTKAKYFFLVYEAFQNLKNTIEHRPKEFGRDSAIRARLEDVERGQAEALIKAYKLEHGEDLGNSGIIGWTIVSKRAGFVANPPSEIYWSAVRGLRMVAFQGSAPGYRKSLLQKDVAVELGDGDPEDNEPNWDPNIPRLLKGGIGIPLDLSHQEGVYLQDRFLAEFPDSLLGVLIKNQRWDSEVERSSFPWQLRGLPAKWRREVEQAKHLSALMRGANLAYNNALGELLGIPFKMQAHEDLIAWVEDEDGRESALMADFDWLEARGDLASKRHRSAREFLKSFRDKFCAKRGLHSLMAGECAAYLELREINMKGGSARLRHESARKGIESLGGRGRADFRWSTARGLVLDVFHALGSE